MEYVWCTLLNRDDFEEATPLEWFSQFEIYKKINNIDQDNNNANNVRSNSTKSGTTYIDFLM
ncbi:hypothetical protein C4D33_05830 [Clostridium perfringens]|uniref:hypothetical protein n=1 Tax=Clostridium perfringens TaxID=1502 RepID=UPI0023F8C604|nr:hypothetical protein [Clostridium perfringens]MDU0865963.1 hypothetical protein [Clostridium perfringens]MDU2504600.1 hypothetical protein [Clostridium perfringens]MDU6349052.1 hypothetical protein [Clostridium perfringens]WEV23505.1 hypothetical protein PL327_07355 [Clostridium perfringens D]